MRTLDYARIGKSRKMLIATTICAAVILIGGVLIRVCTVRDKWQSVQLPPFAVSLSPDEVTWIWADGDEKRAVLVVYAEAVNGNAIADVHSFSDGVILDRWQTTEEGVNTQQLIEPKRNELLVAIWGKPTVKYEMSEKLWENLLWLQTHRTEESLSLEELSERLGIPCFGSQ